MHRHLRCLHLLQAEVDEDLLEVEDLHLHLRCLHLLQVEVDEDLLEVDDLHRHLLLEELEDDELLEDEELELLLEDDELEGQVLLCLTLLSVPVSALKLEPTLTPELEEDSQL